MAIVLRKMMKDVLPTHMKTSPVQLIEPKSLPSEVMQKCMQAIIHKGWIDLNNLHIIEQLLGLCGSDWLCENAVLVSNFNWFSGWVLELSVH